MDISQKDWKLFRAKLPGWQEAYMERLNKEYIQILNSEGNPSDIFWTLEKRISQAALILTAMNAAHRLARWLLRFFADNPFLQFLQFLWLPAGNREFFQ